MDYALSVSVSFSADGNICNRDLMLMSIDTGMVTDERLGLQFSLSLLELLDLVDDFPFSLLNSQLKL